MKSNIISTLFFLLPLLVEPVGSTSLKSLADKSNRSMNVKEPGPASAPSPDFHADETYAPTLIIYDPTQEPDSKSPSEAPSDDPVTSTSTSSPTFQYPSSAPSGAPVIQGGIEVPPSSSACSLGTGEIAIYFAIAIFIIF